MSKYVVNNLMLGCIVFAGISLFARIPFLGWFGWVIALGVWIWLASKLVADASEQLALSVSPRIPAMAFSALLGAATGLVGALTSLILNMAVLNSRINSPDLASLNASFGAMRDLLGLFTRPVFGALVCGLAGLGFGGGVKGETKIKGTAN